MWKGGVAIVSRPTKLSAEVQEQICNMIRAGNDQETAARIANVHPGTFYRWMQDERPAYREFREAVEKAHAQAEAGNVTIIVKAAERTWQAAAWWLERRYAPRWGRRERHEISGPDSGPVRLNLESTRALVEMMTEFLPPERMDEFRAALLRRADELEAK